MANEGAVRQLQRSLALTELPAAFLGAGRGAAAAPSGRALVRRGTRLEGLLERTEPTARVRRSPLVVGPGEPRFYSPTENAPVQLRPRLADHPPVTESSNVLSSFLFGPGGTVKFSGLSARGAQRLSDLPLSPIQVRAIIAAANSGQPNTFVPLSRLSDELFEEVGTPPFRPTPTTGQRELRTGLGNLRFAATMHMGGKEQEARRAAARGLRQLRREQGPRAIREQIKSLGRRGGLSELQSSVERENGTEEQVVGESTGTETMRPEVGDQVTVSGAPGLVVGVIGDLYQIRLASGQVINRELSELQLQQ